MSSGVKILRLSINISNFSPEFRISRLKEEILVCGFCRKSRLRRHFVRTLGSSKMNNRAHSYSTLINRIWFKTFVGLQKKGRLSQSAINSSWSLKLFIIKLFEYFPLSSQTGKWNAFISMLPNDWQFCWSFVLLIVFILQLWRLVLFGSCILSHTAVQRAYCCRAFVCNTSDKCLIRQSAKRSLYINM